MDKPGEILNGQDLRELREQFTYHRPHGDQPERYERLRDAGHALALEIVRSCPPSADRTAAIRWVRTAIMTANAAIAIGEAQQAEPATV